MSADLYLGPVYLDKGTNREAGKSLFYIKLISSIN